MALVPVFMVFFYLGEGRGDGSASGVFGGGAAGGSVFGFFGHEAPVPVNPGFAVAALAVFVAAALTDAVDGQIARKRGLITNFGKLMDPLADKVLTAAALICFVDTGLVPAWIVVVIIAREFLVTGLRGVAASAGEVIAAGPAGKLKTVLQMGTVGLFLLGSPLLACAAPFADVGGALLIAANVCLWAALAVTVWSGAEYVWKCRKFLNMK
jgi:CDP-diacylglycerol--glycerol-3-phosphate 3-phosphatidyltransferase